MKIQKSADGNLYSKVVALLHQARNEVVRSVNRTMIYTYYEIGRMIVEDEQQGQNRAEYGKQVLKELSERLTAEFGKGFSQRNIEQMRQFYFNYSIPQTLSAELETSLKESKTLSRDFHILDFQLSWSHYLFLMRIDNSKYQTVLPSKKELKKLIESKM